MADPDLYPFVIVPVERVEARTLPRIAREILLKEQGNDAPDAELTEAQVDAFVRALRERRYFLTYDAQSGSLGCRSAEELENAGWTLPE